MTPGPGRSLPEEPSPAVPGHLGLPALLAHALVAFCIEVDNEFERRVAHRTTDGARAGDARRGPWLVSSTMWFTCLRFVDDDGTTVGEVARRARTGTTVDGWRRWGWVTVTTDGDGPGASRRSDPVLRATRAGRRARAVWPEVLDLVEGRWRERVGAADLARLRTSLAAVPDTGPHLPDCLPILGYGMFSSTPGDCRPGGPGAGPAGDREERPEEVSLCTLLSRALLVAAIRFEDSSAVSLAISANVLRVLDEDGVKVRDIPALTGVARPTVEVMIGWLVTHGFVELAPVPAPGRGQLARLGPDGHRAGQAYHRLVAAIEGEWRSRSGEGCVNTIREVLEPVVGDGGPGGPLLAAGLEPPPDGWRASVPRPTVLPHFPVVTHRGGYPDGS